MEQLNIVELIEKNPITKLSSVYNNKLLNKIKDNFTCFEQQLFVSSFYCYLNFNKTSDFIIDLDHIWKWLGFQQKINAKMLLEKYFKLDIDYKNLAFVTTKATLNNDNLVFPIGKSNLNNQKLIKDKQDEKWGGHNKQTILLTIKCFKSLCLKSQTKKANEIHEYYMKMEDILQEIVEEETNELKIQLEEKNNLLQSSKKEKQKAVEQTLINQFPINTECIYFGTIDNTNENNEMLIKFGHTNNLHIRVLDHRKNYDNFILSEAFKVQNKVEIENLIKTHPNIKKHMRSIEVNGKNKTEIIAYDTNIFTINHITKYIKEIINSKTYSIDNFNKLLKQNEDLLSENEKIKNQLYEYNKTIMEHAIEINILNDKLKEQEIKLQLFEKENQSVYQNPLLPEDDQTKKFNEFINTMCIVRSDVEESSTNMEGAYRIWNKIKPKKATFHLFKTYLDTRFKPSRLSTQNKNQVVNGYNGVKLKQIEYKKRFVNNDVENFLFQMCKFSPSGKILNATLFSEYQRWKQNMNKANDINDLKNIKEYLNHCEYVLKSTVWTEQGSNEGYYGILLKIDEYKHKITSSTGKKVEKIEYTTGQVLCIWDTIAKAAEDENISAAKMSRSIKNKIIFNNDYYYRNLV
jgi:hypothetical protein